MRNKITANSKYLINLTHSRSKRENLTKSSSLNKKRAISGVVTTVLLIVLAIAAVVIVWGIVKNQLDEAQLSPDKLCLNPEIKIQSTCYNQTSNEVEVKLSRIPQKEINELVFALTLDQETEIYTCDNNCGNCIILDSGSKTYYLPQPADSLTLKFGSCIAETKIKDC